MHGLLSALAYCHTRGIVHWDVGAANILLDADGNVRLADFGLAVECGLDSSGMPKPMVVRGAITTLYYRAPESLLNTLYGARVPRDTAPLLHGAPADVWSAACVFAEMCDAFPLLRTYISEQTHLTMVLMTARQGEAVHWDQAAPYMAEHARVRSISSFSDGGIRERGLMTMSDAVGAEGADLMSAMLCLDPECRLSAAEALEHCWFPK
jgi:serine/threonine protein kinase